MHTHLHAGFSGFLERHGLVPDRERVDGAVVINFGSSLRVYFRPGPHGDLVFESRLLQLPEQPTAQEELMRRCLLVSWVRMSTHPDIPTISEDGGNLLLQLRVPSDATVHEFEQSLEGFANSMAEWRRVFHIV